MARKFSEKKLNEFKEFFISKRSELITNLNKNNDDLDVSGDETDFVQGKVLSEMEGVLAKRDVNLLNMIDVSLDKIDDGSFGICEECDGRIGAPRLKAAIGCILCIQCKENQEQILGISTKLPRHLFFLLQAVFPRIRLILLTG